MQQDTAASIRIATFNVENLDLPIETRLGVLQPALERLEADVLCLQEVNAQRVAGEKRREFLALDAVLSGTRYEGYHRSATHPPGRDGPADVHNLVTLSRFPITATRQVVHDLVPPVAAELVTPRPKPEAPTPVRYERPGLVTEIDLGGQPLVVVNVHLRAPIASALPGQKLNASQWRTIGGWAEGYYLSGIKRIGQALELRLLAEELFDRTPEPLILIAGDFNAEAGEIPLRLLVGAPEDTGNAALAARSLVLLDRAVDASRRFSVVHHGRPQMLDHMLASHALYGFFRGIEVHNEALGDEAIGYAKRIEAAGSYHAAVVATFKRTSASSAPEPAPGT
ncbi:MAG: endonuclease/exonuclease/phosphatase family protein [Hyphomicrobiaceae bacterium]